MNASLVLALLTLGGTACAPEDALLNEADGSLQLNLSSSSLDGNPYTLAEDQDGQYYYDQAIEFRKIVDEWRVGNFEETDELTGEQLSSTFTNTYNMIWGDPGAIYANQTTVYDSVLVAPGAKSFTAPEALAAYEGVSSVLKDVLDGFSDKDKGIRFVYVSEPVELTSGTYLNVYVNAGEDDQTSAAPFPQVEQLWGDLEWDPNAPCNQEPENDNLITDFQNQHLGGLIRVDPLGTGTPVRSKLRIRIFGNAVVNLITDALPAPAEDADIVLQTLNYPRTGPTATCTPGLFSNAGQYLAHYDCEGNELCFNPTKGLQYFNDHTTLGDGVVRTAWANATGNSSFSRIGAYVQSGIFPIPRSGGRRLRFHLNKYFYGTPVVIGTPLPEQATRF